MKIQKNLISNDIIIEIRSEDGYVNATQMCKAGNKEFKHWVTLKSTLELFTSAKENVDNPTLKLIESKQGRNGGSWIHPDLAVQLAQWISPSFAIQVSRWIRELFACGSVSIDNRRSDEEIKELEQKCFQLELEKNEAKELEISLRAELEKSKLHELNLKEFVSRISKLETNEIIYIGTTKAYQNQHRFKLGGCKTQNAISGRFTQYNSGRPADDLFFCVRIWNVHSFSMIEKIAKILLVYFKDNHSKTAEDYHINGNALIEAIEFIIANSNESVEWFNEHFDSFADRTIEGEPSSFGPVPTEHLRLVAGNKSVIVTEITGWSQEQIDAEIQEILSLCNSRKECILWADISEIIKGKYKQPKMREWRSAFKEYIPRRSERLKIKGLGL
jgi:KilA-N domain